MIGGRRGVSIYLEEAKIRKQKSLEAIKASQAEIDTLKKQIGSSFTLDGVERLRLELKDLQDKNMATVSFEERLDSVASLGTKVYPAEDLKSRRIKCGLDIRGSPKIGEKEGLAKMVYGSAYGIRTRDLLLEREVS